MICFLRSGESRRLTRMGPLLALLLLFVVSGCRQLETDYGATEGRKGRESVAGFAVMREYFYARGWKDRKAVRLSERLMGQKAIVLIAEDTETLSQEAIDWLEQWLAQGNRTLVYVLRDYQTVAAYWEAAQPLAPPDQRLEYRRRVARALLEKQQQLLTRQPQISNGWFTAVSLQPPQDSKVLADQHARIDVEYQLRAFDPSTDRPAQVQSKVAFPVPGIAAEPGSSSAEVQWNVLFEGPTALPLLAQVRAPAWQDSQLFVVAGGSLLTNFGLLQPRARELLVELENQSRMTAGQEDLKVAFLVASPRALQVSSVDAESQQVFGMEVFTSWPLNVLSMHLFVLGVLVCLMLFPIFGRPRHLPTASSTDFADHISAVAALMAKTGTPQDAQQRLDQYWAQSRGQTGGESVSSRPAALPSPSMNHSIGEGDPIAAAPTDAAADNLSSNHTKEKG